MITLGKGLWELLIIYSINSKSNRANDKIAIKRGDKAENGEIVLIKIN